MSSEIVQNNRISDEDVLAALKKGKQKAKSILDKAPCNRVEKQSYFQQKFHAVAMVTNQLLDNFDLIKFQERKNDKLPISELRTMLLGAFEAVSCLEALENHIVGSNLNVTAYGAKIKLIKAASVYASNGQNDPASLCALRMFSKRQPVKGEMICIERHCA